MSISSPYFIARLVKLVPALLVMALAVMVVLPTRLLLTGEWAPMLVLQGVFYWCVYLPESMPLLFLFMLGLLQDMLYKTPLGMSSLLYMGTSYLVYSHRSRVGKAAFIAVWLGFAVVAACVCVVEWSIMSLYYNHGYSFALPATRWLITVTTYPLLHLFFTQCYLRLRINR